MFEVIPSRAKQICCTLPCRNIWLKQVPHTKEWRENQSKSLKGREITWADKIGKAMVGKPHSLEARQARSEFSKGENNPFYGRNHKEETKESISKIRIERGLGIGANNGQYIDGRSYFPYCFKFNNRRRHAVRTFFDFMCIACGCHQEENIVYIKGKGFRFEKLPVHHVDHDKEQGCNGKPFNLVPLCRSCHMKEGNNKEGYRKYVNKTLQEGFKWGIWNEEEYRLKVMYDE